MLSTPTRQECFFLFKMRAIPLMIAVMIARGDFAPPVNRGTYRVIGVDES